ncbi:methylated-DNA--[protein]-cysteine S-methyltransferase [Cumulibacter manganitolerans]|uniref:methylated-DNA--[protein]-cysteine S-methyltransferase n=1 Tax=Cumulibacter manganitolerans TaxID=1884992 RepID=UPI001295F2F3|nr:methylated-DNA--[protein]-cysteine S-methyltransferase [Cumulibacter manganitolerans]
MSRAHAVFSSPLGPLTAVLSEDGLCGLYMKLTKRPLSPAITGPRDDTVGREVAEQLGEYFRGERQVFDLPLDLHGTDFQRRVWALLLEIPYAGQSTYGAIAAALGEPRLVRAVGAANGSNPVSIVVPCHRVVGSSGALTGYAGGVERKRFLLDLEARVAGSTPTLF